VLTPALGKDKPFWGKMKERIKLPGGFVNEVFREDGVVIKHFEGEALVGKTKESRKLRETHALRVFGDKLSPSFLGFDARGDLLQTFIPGEIVENLALTKEAVDFVELGTLLKRIHRPVVRNPDYLKSDFDCRVHTSISKARPILEDEGIELSIDIDWEDVFSWGTTRVHRDFWMGNIVINGGGVVVIDWEFSGIGSPYEDFTIADLWIFREYEDQYPKLRDEFWKGYGKKPDEHNIQEFLKTRCVEFIATTSLSAYKDEEENGFYHNKVRILKELR